MFEAGFEGFRRVFQGLPEASRALIVFMFSRVLVGFKLF